jgi:cellulose synthase/poly-beta-1,6-N-acetylglucosamine synthase-like glycosyltransferase
MLSLASISLAVCAGVLAIPVLLLSIEVLASALPRRDDSPSFNGDFRPRIAVLVPAHNEGAGLLDTVNDIKAQLLLRDRLVVVADNCTDDTAQVARAAGAEVTERFNISKIGKGFALDWGIRHLKTDPPQVVVIVDADCRLASDAIDRLVAVCTATQQPVQGLYLMDEPEDSTTDYRVAVFAFRVKNWARPLGLRALNLPCQLMGTGMAFPWDVISSANLATGAAVEDLKLGLDLARARRPAHFVPSARVNSRFPSSAKGIETQRYRWERGHVGMIATYVPCLVYESFVNANFSLLVLALDAAIPPLTFLGSLLVLMATVSAIGVLFHLSILALVISVASLLGYLFILFVCWLKVGRDVFCLDAILSIASYVASKLPLYRRFLSRRHGAQWIRTDRAKGNDLRSGER